MKTKYSLRLFLTSELLLYFLILVTVFFPSACSPLCGSVLRYISVLLCPSLGFFFYHSDRNPFSQKLLLALTVSCAADYILIFTRAYTAGVLLFCTVQLFYRQALFSSDTGVLKPTLPPFVPLFLLPADYVFPDRLLLPAAGLYLLLSHANQKPAYRKQSKRLYSTSETLRPDRQRCLSRGLFLLLLCDIHVGLSWLFPHISLFSSGIWLFYQPSLVLVVSAML